MNVEFVTKNINTPFYSIKIDWDVDEAKPQALIDDLIKVGYRDSFPHIPESFKTNNITLEPEKGSGLFGTHTADEAQVWISKGCNELYAHGFNTNDIVLRELDIRELL